MNDQKQTEKKYKTHVFEGDVKWTGGRVWDVISDEGLTIKGGSPEKLGGEPLKWSPEDFLLASINTCQLASFLSLCRLKKFEIVSYTSEAEGFVEHDGEGYRYTKIILKPKIGVKSEQDIETAREFVEKAHHGCWMGRSVIAELLVEPEIFVSG